MGPLPPRPSGRSPAAIFAQSVWDELFAAGPVREAPGSLVSRTTRGTMVRPSSLARVGGNARVRQYILTDASKGDYFICRTLSSRVEDPEAETPVRLPVIGTEDIFIAKPFELRRSPFDRAILNAKDPSQIGKVPGFDGPGEITREIEIETSTGSETRKFSYEYQSATFRTATDQTDPIDDDEDGVGDNWFSEPQTIIPRFVPAELVEYTLTIGEEERTFLTTTTRGATLIHAVRCSNMLNFPPDENSEDSPPRLLAEAVMTEGEDPQPIILLALNDGWAWAQTL